jgi:DNA (cytosine-5)-methyltransferase 1
MSAPSAATRRVRALDLFCGAGGSSWGAHRAGVEVVAAFDRWRLAGDTHASNFPNTQFFRGKLEKVKLTKLKKKLGRIDLILASPECTNHSPAKGGKPRCEKSKNTAFQVIRFAKVFQPRWLVIENVVSMRNWSRYTKFKGKLKKLGYHVEEQVLNAMHFGVPQSRRRLFITCDRRRMPPKVKTPARKTRNAREVINFNGKYAYTPLRKKGRAGPTLARARRGFRKLGKKKPFLLVYYGSDAAGGWQRLNRPLRTITTVDRFALVKPDPKHGHVMRMLQVPELQAAMGMPRKLKLESGTRRDRIKLIGNAVCPPVMREVVRQLINGRGGES